MPETSSGFFVFETSLLAKIWKKFLQLCSFHGLSDFLSVCMSVCLFVWNVIQVAVFDQSSPNLVHLSSHVQDRTLYFILEFWSKLSSVLWNMLRNMFVFGSPSDLFVLETSSKLFRLGTLPGLFVFRFKCAHIMWVVTKWWYPTTNVGWKWDWKHSWQRCAQYGNFICFRRILVIKWNEFFNRG